MGRGIELPIRQVKSITVVSIPEFHFGSRVIIQAHEIKKIKRGNDICDGHDCDQTEAKGHVKFFSKSIDINNV